MSSTGDHILWLSSGTTPNLRHQANGRTVSITSSVAIVNDTTWSTIVGTWRPGCLELYVDGFSRAFSPVAATNTSALFAVHRWGWVGEPVRLEVRRVEGGPTFPVEVVPRRIRPNEFFLSAMRASVRVVEREGRRWGYVRVWSYARRQYHHLLIEELAEGRLKNVDGLVLDLRGGWGGAQPEYAELFVGGAPIMTYVGRDGRENYRELPVAAAGGRPGGRRHAER